jgi:hypothetical protein
VLDEERANAKCRSEGCNNKVIPPFMKFHKKKPWYNYMTRCKQCQHNMHKYKITTPERDALLESQSSLCGICNKEVGFDSRTANVDHCHSSGKVRGILCFNCNTAIGSLKDNVDLLNNAIKYLEKHK